MLQRPAPPSAAPTGGLWILVREGDCFSSLAKEHGYESYETLYNAQPSEVKAKFTSPNHLIEGEYVRIPGRNDAANGGPATSPSGSPSGASGVSLSVIVLDRQGKPYTVANCLLILPPLNAIAATEGVLKEERLDLTLKSGTLIVKLPKPAWTPPSAPAEAVPGAPPPYPPPIVPADFNTRVDDAYAGIPLEQYMWEVKIGSLPPHDRLEGVEARLDNLGFFIEGDLSAAVTTYQLWRHLPVTGDWTDIVHDLQTVHDTN